MDSYKITYKKPREMVGSWLAREFNEVPLDSHLYNDEQREVWYKKADKLLLFIQRVPFGPTTTKT